MARLGQKNGAVHILVHADFEHAVTQVIHMPKRRHFDAGAQLRIGDLRLIVLRKQKDIPSRYPITQRIILSNAPTRQRVASWLHFPAQRVFFYKQSISHRPAAAPPAPQCAPARRLPDSRPDSFHLISGRYTTNIRVYSAIAWREPAPTE